MKAATVLLLVASFTAAVSASRLRRPRSHGLGVANPIDLLSLLELDPKTSEIVTDHMNSIKGRETVPAEKSRAVRENGQSTKEISNQEIMSASKTTEFPGVTSARPRVVRMCSRGEKSNVKIHVDTEGVAVEGFQVQAVVTDTATGQTAPLAAISVMPSGPFWLGHAPSISTAAALGGVPSKSTPGKAVQDVILKASPGSTLLGPAAYELHLQIVSPDPEEIASDLTGESSSKGGKNSKYNYARMQTLLDQVAFVPIQIEDCGAEKKDQNEERPAYVSLRAELQHTEADAYFKLTDVDDAAKTAFSRLAGNHIAREQVADFKLEDGDRPGRTIISLHIIFSNRALAHLAAIEMQKDKAHWQDVMLGTLKQTLTSVGITYNPTESPIRHFVIAEESYARDDEAKAVCCLARTAKCMSCSRGISVEAFCALEPQVPGCSSPKDPKRSATVEQHLVDIVLQIHHPKHAIGIFEGKSDVTRELQASMQASVSVLNYADPDMSVKSVQVETTLMPGGTEKQPLVHISISTSSAANAKALAGILKESSTVQKDFMGKALTDAFHATKQLDSTDNLQVDKIQASAISQPLPDSINSMWDKIQRRAELNDDGSISWDEIEEATGRKPPLTKDTFDVLVAGEPRLNKEGLLKLREAQSTA